MPALHLVPDASGDTDASGDHLIFQPELERTDKGIFVHIRSKTEPPTGTTPFRSSSGPFATEATALECLRRLLCIKTSLTPLYLIEVNGQRQRSIEVAVRLLGARASAQSGTWMRNT